MALAMLLSTAMATQADAGVGTSQRTSRPRASDTVEPIRIGSNSETSPLLVGTSTLTGWSALPTETTAGVGTSQRPWSLFGTPSVFMGFLLSFLVTARVF